MRLGKKTQVRFSPGYSPEVRLVTNLSPNLAMRLGQKTKVRFSQGYSHEVSQVRLSPGYSLEVRAKDSG